MFGSQFYLKVTGTTMGSNVAPTFALIFMNWFEVEFVYNHELYTSHVKTWFRYIDDVFLLWQGNTDALHTFHEYLNNCLPSISFSLEQNRSQLAFLDVQLQVYNGALRFDLHRKPTGKNSLLHYQSCHPPGLKKSLPVSQLMRVKRIVSDENTSTDRLNEMASKFRQHGYPNHLLQNHISKLADTTRGTLLHGQTTRSNLPDRPVCVTTYTPVSHKINRILNKHWHILQKGHPSNFQTRPLMSYRKGRNLRDNLVKADMGPDTTPTQTTISGSQNPGSFPCLNCAQCNNIQKLPTFSHPHTGKQFKIQGHFACNSDYVVYLNKCPCRLAYVGETT